MIAPLLAAALTTAPVPVDHPQTFLASIVGLHLKPGVRIGKFSFKTWGVHFQAVCHIPPGWAIKAGGEGSEDGVLEGEGSEGATWLGEGSRELRDLVLLSLVAPVQHADKPIPDGVIPATFKGYARVQNWDTERNVALSDGNLRLTPATRCPARRS